VTCCTDPRVPCSITAHEAAKRDPVTWARLKSIGTMADGLGGSLELRSCLQRGTLARPVAAPFAVAR